ncbi:voltage-dependent calcium channel gamma-5 subunit-like isoform X1 [Anneissia japonica]|uniref:voltage-dependent calcium channel gamma-5 subunit-like isoform X1 n=1 Tax=Anneissia japonica TaxID=1529436 RepID=UPI0014258405|nr:voltage-dependent calcium channel gamma-5 subunit-like isoform X1 [Anneissia japonica]XP_033120317.1 voltage-dependent calcium channel gamma-5 subunit-like isoform X1 [Anneissia japonica]XP_033120318.1 voltage-dependent calcium channel gamma-5 subunit-like isoform X1 [Anneissia japonica]
MVRSTRHQFKQTVVLVVLCATTSVAFLLVAVITNSWLNYMDDLAVNDTISDIYTDDEIVTEPKTTRVLMSSGLWRTCVINGSEKGRCRDLVSFSSLLDRKVRGTFGDPATGWLKFTYWLSFFHIIAMVTDILAVLVFACAVMTNKDDHFIFISGFTFVISGLISMFGLLVYICGVNDELGASVVESTFDTVFVYRWGWSLYFAGVGLTLSEISGFLAVQVYFCKSKSKLTEVRWCGTRSLRRVSMNGDICRFKDSLRRMSSTSAPASHELTYVSHDINTDVHHIGKIGYLPMDGFTVTSSQTGRQRLRPPRRSLRDPVVLNSFNRSFESVFKITSV